ncbi:MAG: hypothetical protein CBD57_04610 [Candidatus Pelagibacter sp. TMED197]|jgi:hypothetical protein|nr:MAG: hypothetical protein CBD57_04610 [Candidatus Pelagibacter sp. TMED197]|tara:strand:- start:476 stop:817 length:342 start_codon:yes stop_codon:yes gene_type:complete
MSFTYNKENLFAEFDVAKQKDIKMSKKKDQFAKENDKFDNRIQFFKDHIELKKTNPHYYSGLDINFEKLLEAWSSTSPIDFFYNTVFGMSYAEKMRISEIELAEKKATEGLGV